MKMVPVGMWSKSLWRQRKRYQSAPGFSSSSYILLLVWRYKKIANIILKDLCFFHFSEAELVFEEFARQQLKDTPDDEDKNMSSTDEWLKEQAAREAM